MCKLSTFSTYKLSGIKHEKSSNGHDFKVLEIFAILSFHRATKVDNFLTKMPLYTVSKKYLMILITITCEFDQKIQRI